MSQTLGSSSDLQLIIPEEGETNWAVSIRDNCFQKIVDHDHAGTSGTGKQLTGTSAITADTIDDTLVRLRNNQCLRARNAANSADVNIIKITASDKVEICTDISKANMVNDTFITSRNNADSADISIVKVDTSDKVILGSSNVSTISGSALDVSGAKQITSNNTVTLTDNTASPTSAGVITLGTDEWCKVLYKIVRNTDVQFGELWLDEDNSSVIEEFSGDDTGVTFSISSGALQYITTSTGNNATMTYFIIKE